MTILTGHRFPLHLLWIQVLGFLAVWQETGPRQWQEEWWAIRPWRKLMRHASVMRLQSCSRGARKEDHQVHAVTAPPPLRRAETHLCASANTQYSASVDGGDMAGVWSHLCRSGLWCSLTHQVYGWELHFLQLFWYLHGLVMGSTSKVEKWMTINLT